MSRGGRINSLNRLDLGRGTDQRQWSLMQNIHLTVPLGSARNANASARANSEVLRVTATNVFRFGALSAPWVLASNNRPEVGKILRMHHYPSALERQGTRANRC